MKEKIFKGSGVAIITPFNDDLSINYNKMEELIEFQIKNDTQAIIVCGTTGESSTLAIEEYVKLITFTRDV
ncbi:MAG: dihydrodipicolinate synthase family protein, partial [Oscillospiraceae bacterium]